jgi:murein DD-endopeptidase MepM/ murein hydrolase activator NlpD
VARREVTFIASSSYSASSYRLTLPRWLLWLLAGLGAIGLLVVVAAAVLLWTGGLRLSRLAYLESRNRRLETASAQVGKLRRELGQLEERTRRLAAMLGVEKTPPPVNWDSVPYDTAALPEWVRNQYRGARPVPGLVPVEGYAVSRVLGPDHQGVDLAAKTGSPVRATADGVVRGRGTDRTYGRFLLLGHAQGYESYYGHLEDWNADKGETVAAGQTIGWVGSTGRSSAPHLHFEIRKDGVPADPSTLVKF